MKVGLAARLAGGPACISVSEHLYAMNLSGGSHVTVMWALTVNVQCHMCQVAATAVGNETSLNSDIVIALSDNI